jgi:hypothetical protein
MSFYKIYLKSYPTKSFSGIFQEVDRAILPIPIQNFYFFLSLVTNHAGFNRPV